MSHNRNIVSVIQQNIGCLVTGKLYHIYFQSSGFDMQKNASLNFCTPDNLFVESYSLEELIVMR